MFCRIFYDEPAPTSSENALAPANLQPHQMTDDTAVSAPPSELKDLLHRLTCAYPELPPQLRQAAKRVLDQPEDVAMLSMRGLATGAEVPPSTMVRLAKAIGF